jgi:hypothetical protein
MNPEMAAKMSYMPRPQMPPGKTIQPGFVAIVFVKIISHCHL